MCLQFDGTYRRKAEDAPLTTITYAIFCDYEYYARKYGTVKGGINIKDCEQPPSPRPEDAPQ